MERQQMDRLVEQHIAAEMAGDTTAAVAMYSDDVEHDLVGWPTGSVQGPDAARAFYDQLVASFDTEQMAPTRQLYGEDFCVFEHVCTGRATGDLLGIPGGGRRVSFRMLHIWEFKDGAISRENIWLDGGAIIAQLTAEQ